MTGEPTIAFNNLSSALYVPKYAGALEEPQGFVEFGLSNPMQCGQPTEALAGDVLEYWH